MQFRHALFRWGWSCQLPEKLGSKQASKQAAVLTVEYKSQVTAFPHASRCTVVIFCSALFTQQAGRFQSERIYFRGVVRPFSAACVHAEECTVVQQMGCHASSRLQESLQVWLMRLLSHNLSMWVGGISLVMTGANGCFICSHTNKHSHVHVTMQRLWHLVLRTIQPALIWSNCVHFFCNRSNSSQCLCVCGDYQWHSSFVVPQWNPLKGCDLWPEVAVGFWNLNFWWQERTRPAAEHAFTTLIWVQLHVCGVFSTF